MRGFLTKLLGNRGERQAARYLRRKGFKICARQLRTPLGEIDLICLDGRTIVFVEVKTRRSDAAGQPEEAVDLRKQRQIARCALWYLRRHGLLERSIRFDVVSVVWPEGSRSPEIRHYEHAFEPPGFGQLFA